MFQELRSGGSLSVKKCGVNKQRTGNYSGVVAELALVPAVTSQDRVLILITGPGTVSLVASWRVTSDI